MGRSVSLLYRYLELNGSASYHICRRSGFSRPKATPDMYGKIKFIMQNLKRRERTELVMLVRGTNSRCIACICS